jgi:hypothetical protein
LIRSSHRCERGQDCPHLIGAMVLNRLIDPGSKVHVSRWYAQTVLPERWGLPAVEVYDERLYRAMDHLLDCQERLEEEIVRRLPELGQDTTTVLYDLTSASFHGRGPEELAERGYSRDHRPDLRQITLGLVTTLDGFPITHWVFPGNWADVTTVEMMAWALQERFGIERTTFVADRGMLSRRNLIELVRRRYRYIIAIKRPQFPDPGPEFWQALKAGAPDELHVAEWRQGRRRFVFGFNPEKAQDDRAYREALLARVDAALGRIARRAERGRFRRRDDLLRAVHRLFAKVDAERFYTWSVSRRGRPRLRFARNEPAIAAAATRDGLFVLRTNDLDRPAADVVTAYKRLQEVERAFRSLKNTLRIHPIFHRREPRVRAHVFLCVLAFLLQRTLEHWLHQAGIDRTWPDALQDLRPLRWNWTTFAGRRIGRAHQPNETQTQLLQASGVLDQFREPVIHRLP